MLDSEKLKLGFFFFFHGVTIRSGPEPSSFWDFIPKVSWSVNVHSVVTD
jgi:hypothetical protein